MQMLYAARELQLRDCWIGAGFVRDAVWDHMHTYWKKSFSGDVDVVWFDPESVCWTLISPVYINYVSEFGFATIWKNVGKKNVSTGRGDVKNKMLNNNAITAIDNVSKTVQTNETVCVRYFVITGYA
nr:nucleotidyltransferase family protein [Enterobacter asburiae]